MKKVLQNVSIGLMLTIGGLSTAQATLFDRGNGLIYDDAQDGGCELCGHIGLCNSECG